MKTSSKVMFSSMMVMSTLLVLSSTNWINMWIGLEINLMSFIPLISMSKNVFLSQSTMMYFLVQSMASMLFMIFILTNKYIFLYTNKHVIKMLIMITMMMKMGMPPFHMWFPEMMKKMNWIMCFLLMTWQKIAPMYITSVMIELSKTLTTIICISAMTGAIGGLNQTSTKKIMAYSSINHMSWMVACAATFKKSWMMYMIMYMMMMMFLSIMMYEYNIMFINQMNIFLTKKLDKMIIMFMMLSIGGLPPFLGFMPKWISIQYMMSSSEFMMMIIMITSSLVTLAYYLRLSTTINLMMSHSQKWMMIYQTNKNMSTYLMCVNLMLPMFIILMNMY